MELGNIARLNIYHGSSDRVVIEWREACDVWAGGIKIINNPQGRVNAFEFC